MNLSFILDGRPVSVVTRPETLAVDVIRRDLGKTGTRVGCLQGECGICTVLLDGELSVACMMPAFQLEGSEVETIDGFCRTPEFEDIAEGFSRAGMSPCRYCAGAKALLAEWIIRTEPSPERSRIQQLVGAVRCRCTVYTRFIDGVRFAAEARRKRFSVRAR